MDRAQKKEHLENLLVKLNDLNFSRSSPELLKKIFEKENFVSSFFSLEQSIEQHLVSRQALDRHNEK